MKRFQTRDEVDFVIVGSGAAGGIMARELSVAGFDVVVLEQGKYRKREDFNHDEWTHFVQGAWTNDPDGGQRQTFRSSLDEEAAPLPVAPAYYARTVGGSSVHFTANFWRFHPIDFNEASVLGSIPGTNLADWPIDYDELEPYYTRVDYEIGVSGEQGPFDPSRSRPWAMPPLPPKASGVLFDKGASALGLHSQPAPMAINSELFKGAPPCMNCGFCLGYGCEVGAKSSTLERMIPEAEATGRCEIRSECTVFNVATGPDGRVTEVRYFDPDGVEQAQRARAVVLCANGAETSKLLLMSENAQQPSGLGNSSGMVGRNLMFNGQTAASGLFEHELNEYKGPLVSRIIHDFYDSDPKRGFYGGGGMDARSFASGPILFASGGLPETTPRWGQEFKDAMAHYYTRSFEVAGHTTSLPLDSNRIDLDPVAKDRFGLPALRVTYRDHDDDLAMMRFLQQKGLEILDAAGAKETWSSEVVPQTLGAHLLGTCRMGNDASTSVVDRYHRSHDVENLFIVDGSSFVTSGRGQPTMTIMALAFRAAEHIAEAVRRGEV